MPGNESSLQWSSQLTVTSPSRTSKLPGDKIILPQSALEQLLQAAPVSEVSRGPNTFTGTFDPFNPYTFSAEARAREHGIDRQQQLPHPLMFRIVNPQNGRTVHAGIREFSAEENEVCLSAFLRSALGIEDGQFDETADSDGDIDAGGSKTEPPLVTVHAKQLPKGTYVRLRPLAAGYDPEDWKALLERHLRENFTTLTTGELLTVSGGRGESFKFLMDKVEPEGEGICVVDTDIEVDIVALSEEQARETLQRRLEKATRGPGTKEGSSIGGVIGLGEVVRGQVVPGEYVDYELREWDRANTIDVEMEATDEANIFLFASPLSSQHRDRPRDDEHVFSDFSARPSKRIRIQPTNVEIEGAEALYVSVNAFAPPHDEGAPRQSLQYDLRAVAGSSNGQVDAEEKVDEHSPDDIQCKNCQQWVPQRTIVLHENFCLRNNVHCEQCGNVFQRRSPEWQNHWHCPHDSGYGNDATSKHKHDTVFHEKYTCPNCEYETGGLPSLAQHRTTLCPGKPILCQFCHLVVPQKGDSDPDMDDAEVLLSGLTPHELIDGSRTTECHLCSKIIRLRDMNTHLRHHSLERLSRRAPRICMNQNCGRTLDGRSGHNAGNANDSLGLCSICFGPLYVDTYDPEGKALRRRIDRRYMSQLMTGCGKSWCQNEYCITGNPNRPSMNTADILKTTRPLIDAVNLTRDAPNTAPFYFCTDQAGQQRRGLAEILATQGTGPDETSYDLAWCVAAVEAGGGDVDKARDWLANWAPAKGETAA